MTWTEQEDRMRCDAWARQAATWVGVLVGLVGLLLGTAWIVGTPPGAIAHGGETLASSDEGRFHLELTALSTLGESGRAADLTLAVTEPDGQPVDDAEVRVTVREPDGETRSAAAEGTGGGSYHVLMDMQESDEWQEWRIVAEVSAAQGDARLAAGAPVGAGAVRDAESQEGSTPDSEGGSLGTGTTLGLILAALALIALAAQAALRTRRSSSS